MQAPKGLLLLALPAVLIIPLHAAPEGTAGPLVGDVTGGSATIWMYAPATAETTVGYVPEREGAVAATVKFAPFENPAVEGASQPMHAVLPGLAPNTRYHYRVFIDGNGDPAWAGSFKTAPAEGSAGRFRVVLTSCMKFGQPQASWYLLLAQQPDLHLTVGDTHYADTTDPKIQLEHHVRYRRVPEFATVIRNVPTYAMWDDHDYGPNDSGGDQEGKDGSLAGWKQFWGNPEAGTEEISGAFYRFQWGEVDFFMMDGRYHRSPPLAPDDESKRMFGDAQFAWLLDGLKSSKAKFKVVASGSTLFHGRVDGWRTYTAARHRFLDRIKEHQIPGLSYWSGDIHNSLVWEHPESDRVGYPLVEVISSGVANSKTRSFATIDFDTTVPDPTMRVRIVWGDGTVRHDQTWRLSQLGGEAPDR